MARIRPIQRGHVFAKGKTWFVTYREDVRNEAGEIERRRFTRTVAPTVTEDGRTISKREAQRIAWEQFLEPLNAAALHLGTLATVAEVWQHRFIPEYVQTQLKASGQAHYDWAAGPILERLGRLTMREVSRQTVKDFLRAVEQEGYQARRPGARPGEPQTERRDYSRQTMQHLRNALSRFFRYAMTEGFHGGPNPAAGQTTRGRAPQARQVLTFDQAHRIIDALPEPLATAALLSMLCSLNFAELAALRRKFVNLAAEPVLLDTGDILPALTLAVRENFYKGAFGKTKTKARRRIVPLTPGLAERLAAVMRQAPRQGRDELVFQNAAGGPLNDNNTRRRHLRPAGLAILGHTGIGWHTFRHCAATFADWVAMPLAERVAMLGHARAAMTMHYTAADLERRRPYLAAVEALLFPAPAGQADAPTNPTKGAS